MTVASHSQPRSNQHGAGSLTVAVTSISGGRGAGRRRGGGLWLALAGWLLGLAGALVGGEWYLRTLAVSGTAPGPTERWVLLGGIAALGLWLVLIGWLLYRRTLRQVLAMIAEMHTASQQVAVSSGQMATASASVAEGANHQAASLQETAASLEQLRTMVQHNDANARQADKLTSEVTRAVEATRQAMEKLLAAVDRIQTSSRGMAGITEHIQEIAAQSGLLSINAALEATRAGEFGRGFAVVAREVGDLATHTRERAHGIAKLVQIAQGSATSGVALAGEVDELLRGAVEKVDQITRLVVDITRASQEQARGMSQIADAVNAMDTVTQSAAASAEQSASGASQLSSLSIQLRAALDAALHDLSGSRRSVTLPGARPQPTAAAARATATAGPSAAGTTTTGPSTAPATGGAPAAPVDRFWGEELERMNSPAAAPEKRSGSLSGVHRTIAAPAPAAPPARAAAAPAKGDGKQADPDDDFVAF